MRALVCKELGSTDNLVVEDVDDPVPGDGQILISIKAAGVNFADVLTVQGKYQVKPPTPFIPGGEAAGVVEALGPGTDRFTVGDDVMVGSSLGAFAEKSAVDVNKVSPMLQGLNFAQAAGFNITYCTTFHAFRQSTQLQAGETLLVLGAAGGVGVAAVELGKAFGARVIAAASSDDKLAFAKAAGADDVINYTTSAFRDEIKALTDGKGVDVVYDPVGGELAELSMRSLAWQGRHLIIGFASGDFPNFAANIALLKEAHIIGVYWGSWASQNPEAQAKNRAEMAEMIKDGKLSPQVTEAHSLENFSAAFDALSKRRAMGKVVLTMD